MAETRERWRKPEHRVTQWVWLDDGPQLTTGDPESRSYGEVYRVTAVKVVTSWEHGAERGHRQWELHVRREGLASSRYGGMGTLYPHQLREVPDWLESILDRATPRGIDVDG